MGKRAAESGVTDEAASQNWPTVAATRQETHARAVAVAPHRADPTGLRVGHRRCVLLDLGCPSLHDPCNPPSDRRMVWGGRVDTKRLSRRAGTADSVAALVPHLASPGRFLEEIGIVKERRITIPVVPKLIRQGAC